MRRCGCRGDQVLRRTGSRFPVHRDNPVRLRRFKEREVQQAVELIEPIDHFLRHAWT
jgi:hypothetical protein